MSEESLLPNGDDGGWTTGGWADIDELVSSPTDSDFIQTAANGEGEVILFDLVDSGLLDSDIISSVEVNVRARLVNSGVQGRIDLALYIGGASQNSGAPSTAALTTSFANYTLITDAGWDADWTAAQLDGMQVELTAAQAGKAVPQQFEVSAVDVVVTYTAGPITATGTITVIGDLAAIGTDGTVNATATITMIGDLASVGSIVPVWGDVVAVDYDDAPAATDVSVTLGASPKAGNLLVCLHRTDGTILSAPSGFEMVDGKDHSVADVEIEMSQKIASGSESVITASSSTTSDQQIAVIEIEGPFPASYVDKFANNEMSSTDEFSSGTTAATSNADEIAVAFGGGFELGGGFEWDGPHVEKVDETTTNDNGLYVATLLLTSIATQEALGTLPATGSAVGIIATFSKDNLAGVTTALGTITVVGDIASNGEHTGVTGTVLATGDLAGVGTAIIFAAGTITITSDLVSVGTTNAYGTITVLGVGISEGVHNAFGVISFIGELIAGGGVSFASGVSTVTGDLAATAVTKASATIIVIGDLAANGEHNTVTGTSTFIGDLVSVGTLLGGIVSALGTITFSATLAGDGTTNTTATSTVIGDLAATGEGIVYATATSTITGGLAATGTTNAYGTIVMLGVGLSEGIHLAAGTITIAGDLSALGQGFVYPVGTSTITGDLAADAKQLTSGTSTIAGDLSAGTSLTFFVPATSTFIGDLNAVGTETTGGIITAFGTITFSAGLAAIGQAFVYPVGTITVIGDNVSRGTSLSRGTITVLGEGLSEAIHLAQATITLIGELAGVGTLLTGKTFTKAFTRLGLIGIARMPYGSFGSKAQAPISAAGTISFIGSVSANGEHNVVTGIITASAQVAASGTQLAGGAILASGQLVAVGTSIARGTITVLGQGLSEAVHLASGTITAIGDLAGIGANVGVNLALGTITATSQLSASGQSFAYALGTITAIGDIVSKGVIYTPETLAEGFVSVLGSLYAEGISFCPITAAGSILISASLSALEDESDDIVPASGSIHVSSQIHGALYHYASGGNILAHGTISIVGDVPEAEIRKVSCIRPTATITILGGALGAFGGDLNQKFATATISFVGDLGISAIYAKESLVSISGSLGAIGRILADGDLSLLSQESEFITAGQIGSGTIDGQKKAVLRVAYGSIELYNNSQGGFYSIGGGAALKEAYGLINVTSSVDAKPIVDATKFGKGSINISGDLDTTEPITSVTGSVITGIGNVVAAAVHEAITATSTMSGDLVASGDIVTVLDLHNQTVWDNDNAFADARYKVDGDGNIYIYTGLFPGYVQIHSLTDWIRPNGEAGSTYKVRATKTSGQNPTSGSLGVWQNLGIDRVWALQTSEEGFNSSSLLIEISIDEVEILASCSVTLIAQIGLQ